MLKKNGITFKHFHIIDTDRLQQQLSRTAALKIQYFNLAFRERKGEIQGGTVGGEREGRGR